MTNLNFDIQSRTLTGEIEWPALYFGTKTWEYEMEFDPSFKKIINGSIDQYDESGELHDCYPLCDPELPDQDFKLKELSPLKINENFFNHVHEPQDNSLTTKKIFTVSRQVEQFGLKSITSNDEKSHNDFEIRKV